MKIRLLLVGKTDVDFVEMGVSLYSNRLVHYCDFKIIEIPQLKSVASLSENQIKEREGVLILKNIGDRDELILLDDRGTHFSSEEFSSFIEKKRIYSSKCLVFVVGGSYGFSDAVYARAEARVSLSKMTFSHQLVRVIFLEQLYRAFTIIKGEPYHHS